MTITYHGPIAALIGEYDNATDLMLAEENLENTCPHTRQYLTAQHAQKKSGRVYHYMICPDCGRRRLVYDA